MTKIYCKFTKKEFNEDIGMIRVIICPLCKCPIEFSYGFIGLGFDVGVEIENDAFHKIIYNR